MAREGKSDEDRKLFSQEESRVPPLPKDENKPLVDENLASHDVMLVDGLQGGEIRNR
jgi:hypothetical protein